MKKLSILFLSTLMALCLFTSCSNDEDIDGTWKYSSNSIDIKTNMSEYDAILRTTLAKSFDTQFASTTLEFKDGKVYGNGEVLGTYSDKQIVFSDEVIDEVASYSIDGKKLRITFDATELIKSASGEIDGIQVQKAIIDLHYKK